MKLFLANGVDAVRKILLPRIALDHAHALQNFVGQFDALIRQRELALLLKGGDLGDQRYEAD